MKHIAISGQGSLELRPPKIAIPPPVKPSVKTQVHCCNWVGGDKGAWLYCDQPATRQGYCAAHDKLCRVRVSKNVDSWVEAQLPREQQAKNIRFVKSAFAEEVEGVQDEVILWYDVIE